MKAIALTECAKGQKPRAVMADSDFCVENDLNDSRYFCCRNRFNKVDEAKATRENDVILIRIKNVVELKNPLLFAGELMR